MIFWKFYISANIGLRGMTFNINESQKTHGWLMKSVLGFTFEKFEKLSFQKFISKFFDGTFQDFFWKFPKNYGRNRARDS